MENEELDETPLLDTIADEVEWSSRAEPSWDLVAKSDFTVNGDRQQLQMDVFEVMLSLVHGAKTLHEQIVHLHGMAQWLHDEADRFHALGMGTMLIRSNERLH
ncbi:hypothetical protein ACFQUU_25180 [Herbaspirillum sp. GCM10030257]|uniref:hypothetical protein n=1 Tax=Herbaspirillum sp. GCM10030257 TaxID=3273393 RepID=UPI00360C3506